MKTFPFHGQQPLWLASILVPILLFALACGAAEQPTPTPTKAPAATVAVPTPTTVATPTPTPAGGVPKKGGQLVVFGSTYPTHFDQEQQCCPEGVNNLPPIYLTLMYDDGPANAKTPTCDYCEKWFLEDGGKTIVFQLRSDATFHDGTPIRSQDVKYSIQRLSGLIDGIVSIRAGWMRVYIDSIETPDTRTLRINLVRPTPGLPTLLAVTLNAIYPEGTKRADLQAAPMGPGNKFTSGPFYIKEAVKDSHMILERNPNYFKKDKNGVQLPYLDSIKTQNFADVGSATAALIAGKVELFTYYIAPPAQYYGQLNSMKDRGVLKITSQPSHSQTAGLWMNFSKPLMQDIKLRQAINLAVDRVQYGESYYGGRYLASSYFGSDTPWGKPESEIWNVIPGWGKGAKKEEERQQARKILADAGYAGLALPIMSGTGAPFGAEGLQRDLVNVGINATLDIDAKFSQRQGSGDFLVNVFPATLAIGTPDELFGNYFLSGAGRNFRQYSNPQFDKLFPIMSGESDFAKQKQLVQQMEDILRADVAQTVMSDALQDFWFISKLHGFEPGRYYHVSAHRGESWWLEQ